MPGLASCAIQWLKQSLANDAGEILRVGRAGREDDETHRPGLKAGEAPLGVETIHSLGLFAALSRGLER